MWITRTFEWVADHDRGAGWRPVGMTELDPMFGLGIAHDALEHFTFGEDLGNEGEAFGCILWGREGGAWEDWRRGSRQHFAGIMCYDAAEFICQHGSVPHTKRGVKPLDEEWAEDQIQRLRTETRRVMESEGFHDTYGYDIVQAEADIEMFARHIRVGFRRAERRWGKKMSAYDFLELFDLVAEHPLTQYTNEPGSENDKLVVCINPSMHDAVVRIDRYRDPYAY